MGDLTEMPKEEVDEEEEEIVEVILTGRAIEKIGEKKEGKRKCDRPAALGLGLCRRR